MFLKCTKTRLLLGICPATDNKQNTNNMEKLLSIVIPVYKVEKFIDKYLFASCTGQATTATA